jgi:superfamily I DNA/RNA helicase
LKVNVIYGPPGTGKTHTLIDIVEKEIKDGTPLNKIAFVTFSRKAAQEAQQRTAAHFACSESDLPHFRTLHSMSYRSVKAAASQIMDATKYRDFGTKSGFSLKGYYSVDEGYTGKDDDFIGLEQLYRNNIRSCDKILDEIDHKRFVLYMQLYRQYKDTFDYLDFTDLLDLYLQHDKMEDVDVAIVDEAQDLTTLQWRVVMKAFRNVKRLYVAGDDDQAIFAWAGADIDAFLQLKGESRVLEHSFRLPEGLVQYAKNLTSLIGNRVEKNYHGDKKTYDIKYVMGLHQIKIKEGESYYLLARNNFLLKQYIEWCLEGGIPFSVRGAPYLTKTEISQIKERKKLDWEQEKIEYANRLIEAGKLDEKPLVNIGTIHSVKGGEADNVIMMTDVSRGVVKQIEWEEDSEHRVFYVGVSRARKSVTVVLPTSKYNYPYLR